VLSSPPTSWTSASEVRLSLREPDSSALHGDMSIVRRSAVLGIAVIAFTLSACTTGTAKPTGVVTGQTAECTLSSPPVKVSLYSGSTFVASATVPAGTSYRFAVAPGSYWITGLGGPGASDVTVRAGCTVVVNSALLDCA
jgi:hypothetical protein